MATLFIPPSLVIERLRAEIPLFADRIAGAAQFEAIEDIQNCDVPALFVLLRDNDAETISNQTSLRQEVDHGFELLLVQDSYDVRKQEAEEISVMFKALILDALNGWLPAGYENSDPLEFGGDSFIESDRSRYVRRYTFNAPVTWCGNSQEDDGQALGIFDKFFADLNRIDSTATTVWNDPDTWVGTGVWNDYVAGVGEALMAQIRIVDLYNP